MTLFQFLSTFTTKDVKVIIMTGEADICTIFSYGVDALDEIYKECVVVSWELTNAKTITVQLDENPISG